LESGEILFIPLFLFRGTSTKFNNFDELEELLQKILEYKIPTLIIKKRTQKKSVMFIPIIKTEHWFFNDFKVSEKTFKNEIRILLKDFINETLTELRRWPIDTDKEILISVIEKSLEDNDIEFEYYNLFVKYGGTKKYEWSKLTEEERRALSFFKNTYDE
jgi:hypothetical protein